MWLVLAVVLLALACAGLAVMLVLSERKRREDNSRDHLLCIEMIRDTVSSIHAAEVLEAAARDYDSIEEQGHMKWLAREHYRAGGPSMPVIWLTDRAVTFRSGEAVQPR